MESEPLETIYLSDEALKRRHFELFQIAKNFARIHLPELLRNPKNAHLRKTAKVSSM